MAQVALSSGALNDTDQIDRVFVRLVEGDALENVEEFLEELEELTEDEEVGYTLDTGGRRTILGF